MLSFSLAGGELTPIQLPEKVLNKIGKWSPHDLDYLIKHYAETPNIDIADELCRSITSIENKAFKLGLKKVVNTGQFSEKNLPWNTGKHVTILGTQHTQFKNGNTPHNTKCDGFISLRTGKNNTLYYHIRLAKAKWEYLHRWLYTTYIGEIPEGGIIRFKDGNTMNLALDNLELITRAENCRRNENRAKAGTSTHITNMLKKERNGSEN